MIVGGLPIAIRELHHLVAGWIRFAMLGSDPLALNARYQFLFFSYAPDFAYLSLSLQSLKRSVNESLIGGIFIAEDQKAPFHPAQHAALQSIFPRLQILPIHDFEWGSPKSTHAEMQMFINVCRRLRDPRDLLVKVDSDVLFLPNAKWEAILRSTANAIGDGHYLQHRYAQGGLYMMRRHLIQRIFPDVSVHDLEAIAKAIDSVGEDMAISRLLADKGHPFMFTRMMLFPDEYELMQRLSIAARREFIALHCHKDKANMANLAARFGVVPAHGNYP